MQCLIAITYLLVCIIASGTKQNMLLGKRANLQIYPSKCANYSKNDLAKSALINGTTSKSVIANLPSKCRHVTNLKSHLCIKCCERAGPVPAFARFRLKNSNARYART